MDTVIESPQVLAVGEQGTSKIETSIPVAEYGQTARQAFDSLNLPDNTVGVYVQKRFGGYGDFVDRFDVTYHVRST